VCSSDLLTDILHSNVRLSEYAEEALLIQKPSLEPLQRFLKNIIQSALS
jgi:hypothetical protein